MGLYQWRLMISLAAARDYLDGQSTVACGGANHAAAGAMGGSMELVVGRPQSPLGHDMVRPPAPATHS